MKQLSLAQGSPEWDAHRASARNASDAPALMGASPYVTRSELIRRRATGVHPEHDAATLDRFRRGHEAESALRQLAELELNIEFYPLVSVSDDGYLSASFDGVSMDETVICECKMSNAEKIAAIDRGEIPREDRWQIVQQFAVCETALRCIYICGDGTADGSHMLVIGRSTIASDIPHLRAAWRQFDKDVEAYQHEHVKAAPVAAPVNGFGALMLRVEGKVLASNLDAFKAGAEAFIARLPKPAELQTDQDFADADAAIKACAEAESRIKAAKDQALAQMSDIDAVMRAADSIAETIRAARLSLDKAVKTEKENRKAELIRSGVDDVREHYASINATMSGYELGVPASLTSDIGSSIKGLKSLDSIRDKISTAVAQAKIAASREADKRRMCIAVIDEHAEHRALIPDAAQLVASKSPDDLRNLIAARVAEHEAKVRKQAEEAAERERERIRREEEARAQREANAKVEQDRQRIRDEERASAQMAAQADADRQRALAAEERARVESAHALDRAAHVVHSMATAEPPRAVVNDVREEPVASLKLGDINAMIDPLSISAEGLARLGFEHVATEKNTKLYRASDVPRILGRMAQHIVDAVKEDALRKARGV